MEELQVDNQEVGGHPHQRVLPLTLENVYEALQRVKDWRKLGEWWLNRSEIDAINHQHGADRVACLKAVIKIYLRGDGYLKLSWRAVIEALYWAEENQIAHDITAYAEAVQDPTMTVDAVTRIMDKIHGVDLEEFCRNDVGLNMLQPLVDEIFQTGYNTDSERNRAIADAYVNIHPDASWEHLTGGLYLMKEFEAARESKSFMSTDPSFTVDNVTLVMMNTEPERRREVWESFLVFDSIIDNVILYVKYNHLSSWEHLATKLYRHYQVAAIEVMRAYLPPRDLTITTGKLMELFFLLDPEEVDWLGDKVSLGLPESEMDVIKQNYQSPSLRKEAYLDMYVHQHPCPSWVIIAKTLRDFGLYQQAVFVENTYVRARATGIRSLGINDLRAVQTVIWNARSKWYDIGVGLRISPDTLDVIVLDNRGICDTCFREMLKKWLRRPAPRPTWMELAEVLRSPVIGYGQLADQLPQL